MKRSFIAFERFIGLCFAVGSLSLQAAAQGTDPSAGPSNAWFVLLFLFGVGSLVAAYVLRKRAKAAAGTPKYNYKSPNSDGYTENGSYELDGEELEWLRKAKKPAAKASKPASTQRRPEPLPEPPPRAAAADPATLDTKIFQEKMRRMQYTQLPINSFSQLAPAKSYSPLALSDDPSLLTAIEQANEEFEEDEAVRELAVRILTAFRTRNSVDALSQIALYDLSSNLRSKAVTTLADFDHESVFETILLACADPTREVRAAAARGLFRLGFDRAHAWKRIIEANDDYRMSHAARAAIEAGIVTKSFERLVHEDVKIAYEAFALVSLLIKAGETSLIFEAIREHKDERVKYALLHVLKVQRDERTLDGLNKLRMGSSWPADISDRIRDAVKSVEAVSV